MDVWKGVTEFLEKVDQKAGELAEEHHQQDQRESSTNDGTIQKNVADEDNDRSEGEGEEEFTLEQDEEHHDERARSRATPEEVASIAPDSQKSKVSVPKLAFPSGPQQSNGSHGGTEVSSLKRQVDALNRAMQDADKAHETTMKKRDDRYLKLQDDFDALTLKLKTLESSVDAKDAIVENSQKIISELETNIELNQDNERELEVRISELQEENQKLVSQVVDTQGIMETVQAELQVANESRSKLQLALRTATEEFSQYKSKTKLILDEKDRALQLASDGGRSSSDSTALHERILEMESERNRLTDRLEAMRKEKEVEFDRVTERLMAAQQDLALAKAHLAKAIDENDQKQMTLKSAEEMLEGERLASSAARESFEASLKEKNDEIRILEKRVAKVSPTNNISSNEVSLQSFTELERRSKELAELVMEKQAALEAKRTEVDQWRTRYEVSQQRLREAEMVSSSIQQMSSGVNRNSTRAVDIDLSSEGGIDGGDFSRQVFNSLSRRGQWGEKVVEVAKGIDVFSLRTGTVLKRSSLLRIAAIVYVVVLQTWVFFAITVSSSVPSSGNDTGPKL